MTNSLLYHSFGLRGYRYLRTDYLNFPRWKQYPIRSAIFLSSAKISFSPVKKYTRKINQSKPLIEA
jgi:hypothetical protein